MTAPTHTDVNITEPAKPMVMVSDSTLRNVHAVRQALAIGRHMEAQEARDVHHRTCRPDKLSGDRDASIQRDDSFDKNTSGNISVTPEQVKCFRRVCA
jgi:hypothetical protein